MLETEGLIRYIYWWTVFDVATILENETSFIVGGKSSIAVFEWHDAYADTGPREWAVLSILVVFSNNQNGEEGLAFRVLMASARIEREE